MEIEVENGLMVKINETNNTASVIKSPKASGTVFIPRSVQYKGKEYLITSIKSCSFCNNEIDFLTFDDNSEIESFTEQVLSYVHLKKLKIPAKIKSLDFRWCKSIYDLTEIEISPNNHNFIYYNNEFLLGKSDINSKIYDVLYFARYDIEDAVIPPQVKVIKSNSFYYYRKLKSVIFPENSELKIIEQDAFFGSAIEKLVLPASLEECKSFANTNNLTNIQISPKSKLFSIFDRYLVKKSNTKNDVFDILYAAPRDIEKVVIPSHIKFISNDAFFGCKKLKTFVFEENSLSEVIGDHGISYTTLEKIVLPPSVKKADRYAFYENKKLKSIEFLGKNIEIGSCCFNYSNNLETVSFPNAEYVCINCSSIDGNPDEMKFLVRHDAKISGLFIHGMKKHISYIESKSINQVKSKNDDQKIKSKNDDNKIEVKNDNQKIDVKNDNQKIDVKKDDHNIKVKNDVQDPLKEINDLKQANSSLNDYIFYLKNHLSKYEKVISYENFVKNRGKNEHQSNSNKSKETDNQFFISSEDEQHQKVIAKIGEGSTCDVFKVVDDRTGRLMCKKVIKECKDEKKFKMLQNSVKEIEVLLRIDHPCICKAIGYNMEEEITEMNKKHDNESDEDFDEEEEEKEAKTTIALFFELLPYSVKDVIDKGMMNNTLKVRIAIEVAFGMSHIHSLRMIHRDLKLENIMMNNIFESKIIDFGLVRVDEFIGDQSTLTKGVGTLAYMSPEMVSEEDYDNKTDVYSYGIVLYVLFVGRLPKQSMKEKLDKVQIKFPKPSSKISQYCIELIKKCTSFEPSKRPSFDEIIDDLNQNSFNLASEVDTDLINLRYQFLNNFKEHNHY